MGHRGTTQWVANEPRRSDQQQRGLLLLRPFSNTRGRRLRERSSGHSFSKSPFVPQHSHGIHVTALAIPPWLP